MKTPLLTIAALLGINTLSHSATFTWDGGTGTWPSNNWNTGGTLPDTDPAGSYVSNGDDITIDSGTVTTDERILFDAGTLTVSGGASLTVDSTGSLSALNLGSAGTAGSLVITSSTANFIGSGGSGRAIRAQNGSSITITDSTVSISSTGSNGSIEMESGTTISIAGTSNVSMNYLRLDSGNAGMMTMSGGTLTLSAANPLRSSSTFNGQFNLTGAIGSTTIVHTDITSSDTNHHLAGKLAGTNPAYFRIDGTAINPATVYDGTNLAAVNADLATNHIVGGRFIQVTEAGGQQTLILTDTPVGAAAGNLTTTVVASLPSPNLAQNPNPGTNLGNTKISLGNAKAQSFSLACEADLDSFVVEINSVTTSGDYSLDIYRAMDGLPWLASPVFSDSGTLPASAAAGDLIQIDLPSSLSLERGSYAVALTGLGATDFNLTLSNDDLFPAGAASRNNSSTNGWEYLTTPTADLVFAALGTKGTPAPAAPANAPNIIFILTDDFGWTDLQAGPTGPNVLNGVNHGSTFYQTPTLARLAAEGLSFTHCFAQPNCAPTRAAILSGQYPARSGNGVYHVQSLNRGNGTTFYRGPSQREDIPASHTIVAEALQAGGYVTAHFGKYHVGNHDGGQATMPENNGYDFNFGGGSAGSPGNYHASSQLFGNSKPGLTLYAKDYDNSYITDILDPIANGNTPSTLLNNTLNGQNEEKHIEDALGDAAIAFMNEVRNGELSDRPFYLQLHPFAVHTPIGNSQARADLLEKYQGITSTDPGHDSNAYAAINESIDQTLVRILNYLEDPDDDGNTSDSIASNTLIVFTSDNGGHIGPTDNDPLRFRKGSFYNGGIRVPLIVWQPGTVPAGTQSDSLVHSVDFFPTLVEHAGLTMPSGINYDGESFATHMDDPATNTRDRSPIFYHFPGYLDQRARPCEVAIKRVNGETYKLIYTYDTAYDGNPSGNENTSEGLDPLPDPWELFAFDTDLSETSDLLNDSYSNWLLYGEIAQSMAGEIDTWLNQSTPDWNAKKITVRSSGAEVPYLDPSTIPAVSVPLSQSFKISSRSYDFDTDELTLTWNSEAGFTYHIESSADLQTWTPLLENINATSPSTTRTISVSDPHHFYRIALVP